MKKIVVASVAAMLCGAAFADISVDLKNDAAIFTDIAGESGVMVDSAKIQLVWNASAPAAVPGEVLQGSLLAVGDVILDTFLTTSGYAGTWSDLVGKGGLFSDTDVGGNILAGYLTVRVFDSNNLVAGDKYLQFNVDVDGSLTAFDLTVPATTYQTLSAITASDFASSDYIIQVPEPSTIGLLGVAGFGIFLARRKTRR